MAIKKLHKAKMATRRSARREKGDTSISSMYKQVDQQILGYLKMNPWSRTEEIADGLATDTANIGPFIQKYRNDGLVKAAGIRRGTRYALKSERSRPPKAA